MKGILFSLAILLSAMSVLGQQLNQLQVGTSKINITPKEPVYLSGYGGMNSDRISDQIHDSLYCRVTALQVNDKKLVFISTDLIGSYLYEEVYEKLNNELGLAPNEVFFSAIHNHNGPVFTLSDEDQQTANYRYTIDLIDKIFRAVTAALTETQPVDMEINTGYAPIGVNRRAFKLDPGQWPWDGGLVKMGRNPNGIVNNDVIVLKLTNKEKGIHACLFEYGCHARSFLRGSKIITGDFFGLAQQKAELILGNNAIVSGFAGASGDVDPYYVSNSMHEEDNWIPEIELMGQLLSQEIVRNYRGEGDKINRGEIKSKFKTIHLPSRLDDEYVSNDSLPKTPMNIMVASIGDIAFIGIGAEVLVEIGNTIKDSSPFKHNFMITLSNGVAGYLPPKELYKERGYEVSNSPFGPEAADMVVKETLQLLYEQYEDGK